MSAPVSVEFITCSYSGDLELCRLLCASVDEFVPEEVVHRLFVPKHDLALFAGLAGPRRIVDTQDDLLPSWFWRVPLPHAKWRARLHLPRRNIYLTPFTMPVRGWIAQQMMKIAATLRSRADVVAHIDSDNFFIRPFDPSFLAPGGKTRFYAGAEPLGLTTHKPWYDAAARLLGLGGGNFYTADYIDQFVVWKRSVVEAMVGRIEETTGRDWASALARTPHFAEYVLYGVFVERLVGVKNAGLVKQTHSHCHTLWGGEEVGEQEWAAFIASLRAEHVVCAIQSTVPISLGQRVTMYRRLIDQAMTADGTPSA